MFIPKEMFGEINFTSKTSTYTNDFEHAVLTKNVANLVLRNRKVSKFYEKLLNFNILPQNRLTGFSK